MLKSSRRRARVLAVAAVALLLSAGTAHAVVRLPQSHIYTPTSGGHVEVGEPVLVTGGGYDGSQADTLVDYQVSVDGGGTWDYGYRTATVPLGGESGITQALWAYVFTPDEPGIYTIVSRVNTETVFGEVSAPRFLYVGVPAPGPGPAPCPVCNFDMENPREGADEGKPVVLGLRFQVDRPGVVTSVATWWNPGEVSGVRLWRGDGTLLAQLAVTGLFPDAFPTPVPVVPGVEYVVSFFAWRGLYKTSENMFTATIVRSPFILPAHAGVYSYENEFPTRTWNDSHYWVSPEFRPI